MESLIRLGARYVTDTDTTMSSGTCREHGGVGPTRFTYEMTDARRNHPPRAEQIIELGELSMRSTRAAGTHTISLTGELDLAGADAVEHELLRVEQTDARIIRLDLSGLTFVDSSGLRLLFNAEARSRADSGRLILLRPPERVQRVLQIAGMDKLLPFAD